ncbi:MAG TPA: DUF4342 domain-containing protein [Peptococcaceae bacterium]|nr:DUF4342 domain-containing protein [Peptococcaceae bacterium]
MRKRTNCSYQEAKELLEKHNGDLIEAIVEFEKKQGGNSKSKKNGDASGFGRKVKQLIEKGFVTRFKIEKDQNTILNIPVNVLLLVVLVTMPFFWLYVILFVVLYFMGYKIRIRKEAGEEVDINELVDDFGSKVRTAADKMKEKPASDVQATANKDANKDNEKKDDVNEIIVE